jgi:hypothetical protein
MVDFPCLIERFRVGCLLSVTPPCQLLIIFFAICAVIEFFRKQATSLRAKACAISVQRLPELLIDYPT